METDVPWYVDIVNGDGREEARRVDEACAGASFPCRGGCPDGVFTFFNRVFSPDFLGSYPKNTYLCGR